MVQFNLRCWQHSKEALQQIQRYVDGIAGLKSDPSQVVFAAITGIPEDSALDRENFDSDEERYDAILAAPGMEEVPNPANDGIQGQHSPRHALATTVGRQPRRRRIVETMKGLAGDNTGVGTVVESICASDYAPALNAIVDRIAAALRQLCLPRPLNRNSNGTVGCEVREVQPAGASCDEERGRESIGTEDVGTPGSEDIRQVCRITQLPSSADAVDPPEGLGWFYDDFTAGDRFGLLVQSRAAARELHRRRSSGNRRPRSLRVLADRTASDPGHRLAVHRERSVQPRP